jgi:hypothetical protein
MAYMNNPGVATACLAQLVEGMPDKLVELDLSPILAENTLFLNVHVEGISRAEIAIPAEVNGYTNKDKFVNSHITAGKMCFLPRDKVAKLQSIGNACRNRVRYYALDHSGKMISVDNLKEHVRPFLEDKKDEFEALATDVYENWESYIEEFKKDLHEFLVKLPTYSETIEKQMLASVPSKSVFKGGLRLYWDHGVYSRVTEVSLADDNLSDEVRNDLIKKGMTDVYDLMSIILNNLYTKIGQALKSYAKNQEFNGRNKNSMIKLRENVHAKNFFKHNLVNEMIQSLDKIIADMETAADVLNIHTKSSMMEAIAENMESMMVRIYAFCKQYDVELPASEVLPVETLEAMLKVQQS